MTALVPPFARKNAIAQTRMAEDGWNSRDPHRVLLAYPEDCRWRNRAESKYIAFLTRKWHKELVYRLINEVWAFTDNRLRRALHLWVGLRLPVLVSLLRKRDQAGETPRAGSGSDARHSRFS
jgi:nuclear transport factor 2 (NTF2) superfamily protein